MTKERYTEIMSEYGYPQKVIDSLWNHMPGIVHEVLDLPSGEQSLRIVAEGMIPDIPKLLREAEAWEV